MVLLEVSCDVGVRLMGKIGYFCTFIDILRVVVMIMFNYHPYIQSAIIQSFNFGP